MSAPALASGVSAASYPRLVADIGGTNARFGWVGAPGADVTRIHKLPVHEHAGPAQAARAYLDVVAGELGADYRAPRRAAFAVATAIDGDRVALTNSPWDFSRAAVRDDLHLDELLLLNDFEALALALPHLRPSQMRPHGQVPGRTGTLAVIGPGTGLGVGGVVHTPHGWTAIPGEGGHATLAATDDFEAAVIAEVRRRHAHVSAERLLSGIGLPELHRAITAVAGAAASPCSAEEVVERGVADTDPLARRTLETFCALLGSFAGNVALTLGARGGVFIGGGIVPRMADLFFASRFRACFEAKGRFRGYLEQVPTALITDTLVAMTGAAAALGTPSGTDQAPSA